MNKKRITVIILSICVISLFLIFIFCNFSSSSKTFDISLIQNYSWFKTGEKVYVNNKLKKEDMNIVSPDYMIFQENNILKFVDATKQEFTETEEDIFEYETKEYRYSYLNNIISINADDSDFLNGDFEIDYDHDKLKLIKKDYETKIVYYYEAAK